MKKFLTIILSILCINIVFVSKVNANVNEDSALLKFNHKEVSDEFITSEVYLDTGSKIVNAFTTDFTYDENVFEVVSVTKGEFCKNVIENDKSNEGVVYFSCFDLEGQKGDGVVATVVFEKKSVGNVILEFTSDAAVLEKDTSENVLTKTETGEYLIDDDLNVLPQTGTQETVVTVSAFIVLIFLLMLAIFSLTSVSIWGGIYFSLGDEKNKKKK